MSVKAFFPYKLWDEITEKVGPIVLNRLKEEITFNIFFSSLRFGLVYGFGLSLDLYMKCKWNVQLLHHNFNLEYRWTYLEKCIHRHHFVINTEKFHNLFIWFFLDINVDKGDFILVFHGHWLQWLNLFLSVFNCDEIQKVSFGFLSKNLLSVGSSEFPNQRYAGILNPCLNGLLEKMEHYIILK